MFLWNSNITILYKCILKTKFNRFTTHILLSLPINLRKVEYQIVIPDKDDANGNVKSPTPCSCLAKLVFLTHVPIYAGRERVIAC